MAEPIIPPPNMQMSAMDPEAQALLAAITQQFSSLRRGNAATDWGSVFEPAINAIENQPAPAMQPAPGRVSPWGQMASTFSSTLADMMGAQGAQGQNAQRLAANEERNAEVEQANFARSEAFNEKRAMQRLGVLMKIGDAKAKQLEAGDDIDKYEAQVKSNLMLAERAKKLQQEIDEKQAAQAHQYRMKEIIAGKKDTPADEKAKAEDREDKNILKFQEDISKIAQKPGSTEKVKSASIRWPWDPKVEGQRYTESGVRQILGRAAATVRSAQGERLRQVALETYGETLQVVGKKPEDMKRLFELLKLVYKDDPNSAKEWMDAHGF
jgi:hypothetical protein